MFHDPGPLPWRNQCLNIIVLTILPTIPTIISPIGTDPGNRILKLKKLKLQFKEVDHKGQRLVICYNPERAEKDRIHRENQIEKLKEKLKASKSVKQLISNSRDRKFIKFNPSQTKTSLDIEKIEVVSEP